MSNSARERPPLVSRRMMIAGAVAAAGALATGALGGCSSSASSGASGGGGSATPGGASGATPPGSTDPIAANVTADPKLHAMLPDSIRSAGMIRVASNIPYPPWEMYVTAGGSQPTGIDYDLSQAIGAKLGVTARFDQLDFDSIIPAILAGKEDIVMAGIWDTAVREKALSFVDYARDGLSILVKKGNPQGIATADDLAGKSVAVQSSTTEQSDVASWSKKLVSEGKQGISVVSFPGDSEALLAVQSGRADCRVEATSAAAYAVKTYGDGSEFELVQSPTVAAAFGTGIVGLGVPRQDTALLHAIQQAVQALMTDGTYGKIMDKYGTSVVGISTAGINQGPKQSS
ncbi:MAG TPA: ABC transporter substrate-binding protein [Streptosporangiaceae bacterium]|nr:ABC transporter substrate-binding protein [Streptosporangiaceae bacterium]